MARKRQSANPPIRALDEEDSLLFDRLYQKYGAPTMRLEHQARTKKRRGPKGPRFDDRPLLQEMSEILYEFKVEKRGLVVISAKRNGVKIRDAARIVAARQVRHTHSETATADRLRRKYSYFMRFKQRGVAMHPGPFPTPPYGNDIFFGLTADKHQCAGGNDDDWLDILDQN